MKSDKVVVKQVYQHEFRGWIFVLFNDLLGWSNEKSLMFEIFFPPLILFRRRTEICLNNRIYLLSHNYGTHYYGPQWSQMIFYITPRTYNLHSVWYKLSSTFSQWTLKFPYLWKLSQHESNTLRCKVTQRINTLAKINPMKRKIPKHRNVNSRHEEAWRV